MKKDKKEKRGFEPNLNKYQKEKTLVLESISDLIAFQDKEHNILWVNKSAADSVEKTQDELIGEKCYSVWQNSNKSCVNCPISEALKKGEPKSGERSTPAGRTYLINAFPVRDDKGKIIGVVELSRDITILKQAEKDLEKSELKYREAYNRIDFYKDIFSHDINNIFQNIKSSIELFDLSTVQSIKMIKKNELIEIIREQIKRGTNLVSNVRRLSEIEEINLTLQKYDIIKVLKRVIDALIKVYKRKKINLKFQNAPKELYIKANELLPDLFENLLINAVRHNQNSLVEILIKFSRGMKEGVNFVKLEFIDNGIGILPEMKEKIFQRGQVERKSEVGLGLGLILVKKIIETYNGQVWIEDKVPGDYSKGSNFVIILPEEV